MESSSIGGKRNRLPKQEPCIPGYQNKCGERRDSRYQRAKLKNGELVKNGERFRYEREIAKKEQKLSRLQLEGGNR